MLATLCLLVAPSVPDTIQGAGPEVPRAQAQSKLPYTFVDFSYISMDADGWSDDPTGGAIEGSLGIDESWFVIAGIQHTSGDVGAADIDVDVLSAGVGYHHPLGPLADLVAGLSLLRMELSSNAFGGGDSSNGLALDIGVRALPAPQFEVAGGLSFVDFDDFDSETILGVSGVYYPSPNFGVFLGLSTSSDADMATIGIRFVP